MSDSGKIVVSSLVLDEARAASLIEARNVLLGAFLFALGGSFALIVVALYSDAAMLQQHVIESKDRLVTPGVIRTAAGFLFVNLATLLAALFKELLKPLPGEGWSGFRVACVCVLVAVCVGTIVFYGKGWVSLP